MSPVNPSQSEPHDGAPTHAERMLLRLRAFSELLLVHQPLDDLLWNVAAQVGQLFGYEDCVLYLAEPIGLVQYAAYGVKNPQRRQIKNRIVVPIGQGIVGTVGMTWKPELVPDTAQDPRYIPDEFSGRSEATVPILYSGRLLGVLDSESAQLNGFSPSDLATLQLLASLVAPRIASGLAERERNAAVDDLARAESSHRDRIETLQRQRLESLGQLAGGLAHDFNNLLTAIVGNIGLAKEILADGSAGILLDEAQVACNKARDLTKQLLAFSSGGAPVQHPNDLVLLLRKACEEAFSGSQIAVEWHLPQRVPVVSFDAEQMRVAVQQLLRNAREAMPDGGKLEIELKVLEGKERLLQVALADHGPGVPSLLRSTIFDPYFTTKEGATGLGLSTAYWIVRRHGGSLALDPSTTQGARFLLTLPIVAEVRRSGEVSANRKLRVLLLDDDDAVRRVLTRMLEVVGHSVVATAEGEACVREFAAARASQAFDVVILDLTLRYGIGWEETFAGLRQVDPNCTVVAISGYHDSPVMANHRAHGFSGVLAKPFSTAELGRVLAEASSSLPA